MSVTPQLTVLFVCTGNICRSPAAHAVLDQHLRRAAALGARWAARVRVDSAGTAGWHQGEPPDPRAQAEGARRGYTVDHPARVVTREDYNPQTWLIAMDSGHLQALRRRAPQGYDPDRIVLFRRYDPQAQGDADVSDPYYGGPREFSHLYDVLERSMPALLLAVEARLKENLTSA